MTITACGSCQYFSINMLQDSDKVQVDNDVIPIGRETSLPSIPQEHHPKDGNKPHRVKTGDEVSEIASRIGVSLDEVGGKILKTLGTHQPQECSDTSLPDRKQKHRSKTKPKPVSTYNLAWFTLWWNRMERESLKDAAAKKIKCEDNTTSARLRILLGCGKELSRGGNNLKTASKTKIIQEWTPVQPSRPEFELSNRECLERGVGKRELSGRVDSPSKRIKYTNFKNLCTFWEGGVVASGGDSEKLHTLFKNTTLGSERKFGRAVMKLPGNLDVEPGTD